MFGLFALLTALVCLVITVNLFLMGKRVSKLEDFSRTQYKDHHDLALRHHRDVNCHKNKPDKPFSYTGSYKGWASKEQNDTKTITETKRKAGQEEA